MTRPLPNLNSPVVDPDRTLSGAWVDWATSLSGGAGPTIAQVMTASPAAFTAPSDGAFIVYGGTVSSIDFQRGRKSGKLRTGAVSGMIPVSEGDILTVTYTAAPTVTFVPS